MVLERFAAETERRSQNQASVDGARRVKDLAAQEQLATAARLKPTKQCGQFERESNALRARFSSPLDRADLGRYLSDLTVAHDECANSVPKSPSALLSVYRFNLDSFRLFTDVHDTGLLVCEGSTRCQVASHPLSDLSQRRLNELYNKYPTLTMSVPERLTDIVKRTLRFSLER